MTAAQLPAANTSPLVRRASVGQYARRADHPGVDFDALASGAAVAGEPGKVWRHELVEGGGGGWFQADAAAAPLTATSSTPVAGPSGGSGAGGSALADLALGGLRGAQAPAGPVPGMQQTPALGSAKPMLGHRILPIAMRTLSLLPRAY